MEFIYISCSLNTSSDFHMNVFFFDVAVIRQSLQHENIRLHLLLYVYI